MNIYLKKGVTLTTEHSASSYGVPVLLIDGVAYGRDDDYSLPLLLNLDRESQDPGTVLFPDREPSLRLADLCTEHSGLSGAAHTALRTFLLGPAVKTIVDVLKGFDADTQRRIIRSVAALYGLRDPLPTRNPPL